MERTRTQSLLLTVWFGTVLAVAGIGCGASPSQQQGNGGTSGTGGKPTPGGIGGSGSPMGDGGMGAGVGGASSGGNGDSAGGSSGTGGVAGTGGAAAGGSGGSIISHPPVGTTVSVAASGAYSVTFKTPAWTFAGNLGAPASGVSTVKGMDQLDSYSETVFTYSANGTRNGRIRVYDHTPVVVFGEKNAASVANTRNFPKLTQVPSLPYHITYGGPFLDYSMRNLNADSPWIYFDANANTFIVSAASHFQNTQTAQIAGSGIVSGIQSNIATLPAGFETTTVLVADTGINNAYQDWGTLLTSQSGKTMVASDATPLLGKFGYWTDNGGAYHYATAPGMNYVQTLTSIKTYFEQTGGMPLAYMQLDSWWYPKGADQLWSDINGGIYLYQADTRVFPNGLAGFEQTIGMPLMVHARWIDASSPYRSQYTISGNVAIDPAYWKMIATSMKAASVFTYEQDWLSVTGMANTNNLTDQDAYLDTMAQGMAGAGIDIQYCMAIARHILQSSKYQNVTNSRVSDDRFDRNRWRTFFYGSRMVYSVALWPWSDVYKSTEHDNLLLSLLTAGPFGSADALNAADFPAMKRAIRPDGVIIKPDVPILLLDRSIVDEARGTAGATIATTYTQHTGGRFTYVFAFTDGNGATASFTPAELGYTGSVVAYDVKNDSAKAVTASQAVTATLASSTTTAYFMLAPVGPSGIAVLGEAGKLVPVGKKRISSYVDDGSVALTIQYGAGEGPVTLQGFAPAAPKVTATSGTVGAVSYNATTQRFTIPVTAAGTTATIRLAP